MTTCMPGCAARSAAVIFLTLAIVAGANAAIVGAPVMGRPAPAYHPPSHPPVEMPGSRGADSSHTFDFSSIDSSTRNPAESNRSLEEFLRQLDDTNGQGALFAPTPAPAPRVDETKTEDSEQRRQQAVREDAIRRIVGTEWAEVVAPTALPVATLVKVADDKGKSAQRSLNFSMTRNGATTMHQVMIPRWEFFGIERGLVAKRFSDQIANGGEPILFLAGDLDFSTNTFLPDRLTARTFDSSARFVDEHLRNVAQLQSRALKPSTTAFFNLVAPEQNAAAEPREARRWEALRKNYDDFAAAKGLQKRPSQRDDILKALGDGTLDTIVIVGHGDADAIHLPDGSSVTVQDVLALPSAPKGRAPIVVLVACETGRASRGSVITIAQALLLQGRATAVVAPTRKIPAGGASLRFLEGLFGRDDVPAADAFKKIGPPWQLYVQR